MKKYSQAYTELSNLILGLSDYQRSQVLGVINKFLRNQNSKSYYAMRRSNRFESLSITFFLGFVCGIILWGSFSIGLEYFNKLL